MSAVPVYLGLMALARVFMVCFAIKDLFEMPKAYDIIESIEITEEENNK